MNSQSVNNNYSLGITLQQLQDRFNNLSVGYSSLRIDNVQTQETDDGKTFQDTLTDNITLVGEINPDGNIRYVSLIQGVETTGNNGIDDIWSTGTLINSAVFGGNRSSETAKILSNLGLMSSDTVDFSTINNRTVYDGKSFHIYSLWGRKYDNQTLDGYISFQISDANDSKYN